MKKLFTLTIIALTLSVLACQDSKEEAKYDAATLSAYKTIGHQISTETGVRWIEAYNQKNNIGKISLLGYSTSSESLEQLMALPGLVGIAFHHALDENGRHHYIAIPVGEDLSVWSQSNEKVYIDTNSDTEITLAQASEWTGRYKDANEDKIWFHFFGRNVFDEISGIAYLNEVNIVPALNDLDLSPQLLLIILDNPLGILGRSSSEGTVVYDASSPCPPCPVN